MTISEKYRKALIIIDRNEAVYNDLVHRFEKLKKAARDHQCDPDGWGEMVCYPKSKCTITEALK